MTAARTRYVALTGGVGGAKLCLGLSHVLVPGDVAFVVNTGDDFEHLGLHVAPDLDTLMYSLAGLSNADTGWGRAGETWNFITALGRLGGDTWFNLGDSDLATHVRRTQLLAAGHDLTETTRALCKALGVEHEVLPMSNDPVRTRVLTADGGLSFQHYFVRDRCEPVVTGFEFEGAGSARLNPRVAERLADPALAGVIICPSNPYVSVDPLLALGELSGWLRRRRVPVVAVSPIVGGVAIKGPTAKMMNELSLPSTATEVARHYREFIDGFVVDQTDAGSTGKIAVLGPETTVAQTVMVTLSDKIALARAVIDFVHRLTEGNHASDVGHRTD